MLKLKAKCGRMILLSPAYEMDRSATVNHNHL